MCWSDESWWIPVAKLRCWWCRGAEVPRQKQSLISQTSWGTQWPKSDQAKSFQLISFKHIQTFDLQVFSISLLQNFCPFNEAFSDPSRNRIDIKNNFSWIKTKTKKTSVCVVFGPMRFLSVFIFRDSWSQLKNYPNMTSLGILCFRVILSEVIDAAPDEAQLCWIVGKLESCPCRMRLCPARQRSKATALDLVWNSFCNGSFWSSWSSFVAVWFMAQSLSQVCFSQIVVFLLELLCLELISSKFPSRCFSLCFLWLKLLCLDLAFHHLRRLPPSIVSFITVVGDHYDLHIESSLMMTPAVGYQLVPTRCLPAGVVLTPWVDQKQISSTVKQTKQTK